MLVDCSGIECIRRVAASRMHVFMDIRILGANGMQITFIHGSRRSYCTKRLQQWCCSPYLIYEYTHIYEEDTDTLHAWYTWFMREATVVPNTCDCQMQNTEGSRGSVQAPLCMHFSHAFVSCTLRMHLCVYKSFILGMHSRHAQYVARRRRRCSRKDQEQGSRQGQERFQRQQGTLRRRRRTTEPA
jgi:hypothetical protein